MLDAQAILDEEVVQNSLTAHTSFNEDSYQRMANTLAGYPEGRIIKVTYFSQNTPITDIRSKIVDLSAWTKDDVHLAWTEIRQFEIRASGEIGFSYEENTNNTKINGEGLVFPGFNPQVGDIFIYRIRNGKIGIFYISNVSRLALGQETYHSIEFVLQDYLTPAFRSRLSRQATAVFYFDKQKFLTGNYAFMSSEGYIQQKELNHLRKEIIQNYCDRFYSNDMSSFIRPDGIYDPYAVEFWNKKVSVTDCYQRPLQLLISMKNFKKTIWAAMTNNPIKDLRNLARNWSTEENVATFWSINVTSLLGHKFLTVGNEEGAIPPPTTTWGSNYAVPAAVTTGNEFTQTEHEKLRELSDETMRENRRKFYHDFLPFRMCAPHQHPARFHVCDPKNCEECVTDPFGHHHKIKKNIPPFPILSDKELEYIWRRMRGYDKNMALNEAQRAEVRGYIVWYRTIYPGTLSRVELETEWRKLSQIDPDQELTAAEAAGLIEYIKSYRAKFAPVLRDRELEIIWRTQRRINYSVVLNETQIADFLLYKSQYRDQHGFPPKDGYEITDLAIGGAITEEELRKAGAVIYGDPIMLSMTARELIDYLEEKIPPAEDDPIPPDYVPTVYFPRYPKPWHHVHCHDICHELCQRAPAKKTSSSNSVVTDSYGLSSSFYEGSAAMSPFEQVVYDVLTNKEVNPARILAVIENYLDWDDESAFYMELFALFLIDKALYWLRYHS